jgi:hypothetical protein
MNSVKLGGKFIMVVSIPLIRADIAAKSMAVINLHFRVRKGLQ